MQATIIIQAGNMKKLTIFFMVLGIVVTVSLLGELFNAHFPNFWDWKVTFAFWGGALVYKLIG